MSELTAEVARKLKVVDLKAELLKRSLDVKGKKNELLTRLLEALGASDEQVSQDEESQGEEEMVASSAEVTGEPAAMEENEPAPVNGGGDGDDAPDVGEEANEAMDESAAEPTAGDACVDATEVQDEAAEEAGKSVEEEKEAGGHGSMQVLDEAVADERDLLEVPVQPEDRDPEMVVLDVYNSELNFRLEADGLSGTTQSASGLFRLWGGARANWGAKSGKVFFHVTVGEGAAVDEEIFEPTGVRVGFSEASWQYGLGDEAGSFGYASTGQAHGASEVRSYGCAFGVGDIVTCCLDLESETRTISYLVNGEAQGVAFVLPESVEVGTALFPHLEVKNLKAIANFDGEGVEFSAPEDYVSLGSLDGDAKVCGVTGPKSAEEASVLMMIGLPGVGKTTWANKHAADNAEKRFNVVGIDQIARRMRVDEAEVDSIKRWQKFAQVALDIQYKLICLAEKRCRNYIMDQTNVYNSVQRRRMQPFGEYSHREAVVVFTDSKTLAERTHSREQETGKIVPGDAFFRMITSFVLPQEGRTFSAVTYTEQDADQTKQLLQELQSDAQQSSRGGSSAKRPRYPTNSSGYANRDYDYRDRRGSYGRDSRDGRRDYNSGSGSGGSGYRDRYNDRSSYGGGGGGSSSYQSRGNYSSDRHSSSSYSRPPPPGYGRRPPPAPPARYEPSNTSSYGGGSGSSRFDSRRGYSSGASSGGYGQGSSGASSSGYGRGGSSSGGSSYGRSSYGGGSSYSNTPSAGSYGSSSGGSSYQSGGGSRYDSYSSGSSGYGASRGGSSSYGASSGYRGGSSTGYGSSTSSYGGGSSAGYGSSASSGYAGSATSSYGQSSGGYGSSGSGYGGSSGGASYGSSGGSSSGYGSGSTSGYGSGGGYSRGGGGGQSYGSGGSRGYGAGSSAGGSSYDAGQQSSYKPTSGYGGQPRQPYGGHR